MSISKIFFVCFLFASSNLLAQYQIQELTAQKGVSIRSLSIPSENVIWASGSNGMIAKSTDAGKNFDWFQVKGFEKRDFRAMHAWNAEEAIIVAIAAPAVVLKTKDGGQNWYKVYENKDTAMFLDAIQFRDTQHGTIIGDPINGVIFMLSTANKGEDWVEVPKNNFISTLKNGEAFFASSNSNIVQFGRAQILVTGGLTSRLWMNGVAMNMPLLQGRNSTGANSIAVSPNHQKLIVVGGDFSNDKLAEANIVGYKILLEPKSDYKHLTKKNLILSPLKLASPKGYKSSVEFVNNHVVITCGTSGVDVSTNSGKSWQRVSDASYHVVKRQLNQNAVFLAGSGGRITYLKFK